MFVFLRMQVVQVLLGIIWEYVANPAPILLRVEKLKVVLRFGFVCLLEFM